MIMLIPTIDYSGNLGPALRFLRRGEPWPVHSRGINATLNQEDNSPNADIYATLYYSTSRAADDYHAINGIYDPERVDVGAFLKCPNISVLALRPFRGRVKAATC